MPIPDPPPPQQGAPPTDNAPPDQSVEPITPETPTATPTPAAPTTKTSPNLLPHYLTILAVFVVCLGIILYPREKPQDTTTYVIDTQNRPVLGDRTKGQEVVYFYDYQCPYCRQFDLNHIPAIKEKLIDRGLMHLVFMESPFLGPTSKDAAIASKCAYAQGNEAFMRYHKALLSQQGNENHWITNELLTKTAQNVQLNIPKFETCRQDPKATQAVEADVAQHKNARGSGTPEVYVSGQKTPAGGKNIQAALLAKQKR